MMSDIASTPTSLKKTDPDYVHNELRRMLRDSYKGQRWWSFGNGFLTTVIVLFSAVSATVAQAKEIDLLGLHLEAKTLASILSIIVTVASTVQTKMGFERKWAANRATQSALRQLRIDEASGHDANEIEAGLKRIIATHDQSIIGSTT